jgi:hypothetical protein
MQAVDSILAQRFGGSFFSSFAGETSCSIFLSPMREELDWSKICTLHFSDGESCLHCSLFCLPEVLINSTTHWAASNLSCCLCEVLARQSCSDETVLSSVGWSDIDVVDLSMLNYLRIEKERRMMNVHLRCSHLVLFKENIQGSNAILTCTEWRDQWKSANSLPVL